MTVTLSPSWQRAMRRALAAGMKPTRLADGRYRVGSKSQPGSCHYVSLDAAGHIIHCGDCRGWAQGGRERPCWHAGAVALAIAYTRGDSLVPVPPVNVAANAIESTTTRNQPFPEVA